MTLTPTSGPVGIADAGQMLADGNCKPWTSGLVAQTMECADDTAARKYDIGFGDGYHPFRPRFYVTFWATLGVVSVRPEGENDLTTEIEDQAYSLKVTVGSTTEDGGPERDAEDLHQKALDDYVVDTRPLLDQHHSTYSSDQHRQQSALSF